MTVPDNVDAIHSMIIDNWWIFTKNTAETLVITQERVGYIIQQIFDMRKLSAKWVPKGLDADQKHDHVVALQAI